MEAIKVFLFGATFKLFHFLIFPKQTLQLEGMLTMLQGKLILRLAPLVACRMPSLTSLRDQPRVPLPLIIGKLLLDLEKDPQ